MLHQAENDMSLLSFPTISPQKRYQRWPVAHIKTFTSMTAAVGNPCTPRPESNSAELQLFRTELRVHHIEDVSSSELAPILDLISAASTQGSNCIEFHGWPKVCRTAAHVRDCPYHWRS
jgi:hypothetical protein